MTILRLLKKDLLLELRQQHSFYGILLYVASTVFVLYLAVQQPDAEVWNALFWMIQLFICVNGVAKSFLQENRGRMLYYYSIAGPVQFILSKIIYNVLIMLVMSATSIGLFLLFWENPLFSIARFFGIIALGALSLSLVFTLLAAIAARAQQQAALMAIMGFPIIVPQLMLLMRISKAGFGEVFRENALLQLTLMLGGLDLLVVILSVILFPFLWKD